MRSHYLVYLRVIKEKFLGRRWQVVMNLEFEQQAFRQDGHEKETPQQFLGRRTRAVRMLANSDDGGPLEVFLVMRRAPIIWSTILVLENIQSSEDLYDKVNEHEAALVEAVRRNSGETVTVHNLASSLKKIGVQLSSSSTSRRANFTSLENAPSKEDIESESPLEASGSDGMETIKQVYQTLKKRQRPPPKGGYPFSKNDHVTTKMGKAPPSPCKVCGSANHWDRECPDWEVYLERQRRGVLLVELDPISNESELLYHSAYMVLMDDRMTESSF
jgi:hypothetical protein